MDIFSEGISNNLGYMYYLFIPDVTPCNVEQEEAQQANHTWYIPRCTASGLYEEIQCKTLGPTRQICYCADPHTGAMITGSFNITNKQTCRGK